MIEDTGPPLPHPFLDKPSVPRAELLNNNECGIVEFDSYFFPQNLQSLKQFYVCQLISLETVYLLLSSSTTSVCPLS